MNPKHFRYAEADGIATIRLDRPERLNALTFESYAELRDAFTALHSAPSVRAIVLTGTGRAFCSGGDVKDIIGRLFDVPEADLFAFTRMTCDLIENMRRCEKPIVAALNGTTCGAGAVMAAAADVRVAADTAKIAFLFTKVGLSGADMGAAWLLPRKDDEWRKGEPLQTFGLFRALLSLPIGCARREPRGPAWSGPAVSR